MARPHLKHVRIHARRVVCVILVIVRKHFSENIRDANTPILSCDHVLLNFRKDTCMLVHNGVISLLEVLS